MSDVTIVTEDAERLVREGGVVNRGEGPPDYWCYEAREWLRPEWPHNCSEGGRHESITTPFPAELEVMVDDPEFGPQEVSVGTVTVVDVHHADDCYGRPEPHGLTLGRPCHPDAEPDMWHWTIKDGDR